MRNYILILCLVCIGACSTEVKDYTYHTPHTIIRLHYNGVSLDQISYQYDIHNNNNFSRYSRDEKSSIPIPGDRQIPDWAYQDNITMSYYSEYTYQYLVYVEYIR